MNAFLLAVVVAVGLGVIAALALTSSQQYAYQAYTTTGARVSDPGHNLVGQNWSGQPSPNRS
jgi:hypothetical protein